MEVFPSPSQRRPSFLAISSWRNPSFTSLPRRARLEQLDRTEPRLGEHRVVAMRSSCAACSPQAAHQQLFYAARRAVSALLR